MLASVGYDHVNIAKHLGKNIREEGTLTSVKYENAGQTVNIKLFACIHNNLATYDLLADHVANLGFSVPTLDKTTDKYKLDLEVLIFSLQHSGMMVSQNLIDKYIQHPQNRLLTQFNQLSISQTTNTKQVEPSDEKKNRKRI